MHTEEQLKRLAVIAQLPRETPLRTRDAALWRGVSVPVWERLRSLGRTPPAIRISARALAYRKGLIDDDLERLTEAEAEVEAKAAKTEAKAKVVKPGKGTKADALTAAETKDANLQEAT
jgi:hypothetical protein